MRRIEAAPTESPFLECCDHGAACFTKIFEKNPLPKGWAGIKRLFIVLGAFSILISTCVFDWTVYACMPELSPTSRGNGTNPRSHTFQIIHTLYLTCLIASSIVFVFLQLGIYVTALWRKTWRQNLVLVVEMTLFSLQLCIPPILLCILFSTQSNLSVRDACEWQILGMGLTHLIALVFSEFAKMLFLGLCCCCCFTCCLGAWPLYKMSSCECESSTNDIENGYFSSGDRRRTFASTVLYFLPPESDRGSWLTASKWCLVTSWIFPMAIAAVLSSACVFSIAAFDQNFLYDWFHGRI